MKRSIFVSVLLSISATSFAIGSCPSANELNQYIKKNGYHAMEPLPIPYQGLNQPWEFVVRVGGPQIPNFVDAYVSTPTKPSGGVECDYGNRMYHYAEVYSPDPGPDPGSYRFLNNTDSNSMCTSSYSVDCLFIKATPLVK